jgi:hypothetical protein
VETNKHSELLKQKIKTALEATSPRAGDAGYIESSSTVLALQATALRTMMGESKEMTEAFKSDLGQETSEYNQERRKWIRYRQSRSKAVDEIIKRKDELARLIKEGKIDVDHLVDSAAKGDVQSLITIKPFMEYMFQRYEPSWWERLINFLLRRKIDASPS